MNSNYKYLLLLFLVITIGACEEMLEPDPENIYTTERALKEPSFAQGLLDRAYVSGVLANEYTLEDVATDNAVSNNKDNAYLRMATGEWSAIYNPVNVWNTSYNAIFHLNFFLSIVDDVEWSWKSENRNQMFADRFKGEALGLRAYHYLRLLTYHGGIGSNGDLLGVPLVTSVISVKDDWQIPRSTYQACVEQIRSDLDEAFKLLPYKWQDITGDQDYNNVYGTQNQNRIQGQIVQALKARLALHSASPAFNGGNYNMALSQEAAAISGALLADIGGVAGLDPQGYLFYDNDNDISQPEILWRNNYANSNNRERQSFPPSLFGNGDINPTQDLVDAFSMTNGYPITSPASGYDPLKPYDKRDLRLKSYILYNGNKLGSAVINTDVNSPINGLNKSTTSTRTGYYMLKLLRTNVNLDPKVNSSARHFYTHIRFTELFLIYAEAANQAWGPDGDPNGYGFTARNVIAALRKRAGIVASDPYLASITSKEAFAGLIQNERRLELCFEGFRFWDLRRWKLAIDQTVKGMQINGSDYSIIDVENRNYEDYMYYGPIPNSEIVKYDKLIQNAGW